MTNEQRRDDDADPQETREWLDALAAVLDKEGPERAHFLLEALQESARLSGAYIPFSPNTAYVNTIPPHLEESSPGDHALEWKIRSLTRWNAMAMVVNANREHDGIGGHIASYASSATLYDVGFNHFWKGPQHEDGADLVYIQGHSAPGIYARSYLEGRLSDDDLHRFRTEVGGKGLRLLPARLADAGILAVRHRQHGPGADHRHLPGAADEIPASPRAGRHGETQGLVLLW